MEYTVIYSSRRTLGLTVKNGQVIVRAPRGTSRTRISDFVGRYKKWIEDKLGRQRENTVVIPVLTDEDVRLLKKQAKEYFTAKVAEYSEIMGLKPSRITITSAQKRFGSCNQRGNICFAYRLILYPERAREYVAVHELAHLKHLNHSPEFYALVAKYMPDYKERRELLRVRYVVASEE